MTHPQSCFCTECRGDNFGFDVRDPSNADPWGRSTGLDGRSGQRESPLSSVGRAQTTDSGPVSEYFGYKNVESQYSQFVAVIFDELQIDSFLKCVMLQLNSAREEIRNMAQAPAPSQNQSSSSGGRTSKPSGNARSGIPFLKVELMSATPKKAKIMDYQIPDPPANGQRQFNDVVLKVFYNGSLFLWGLKSSSPHYANLFQWFGNDLDDWRDKEFMLGTETREFDGRVFAHTEPIAVASGGRKK